LNQWVIQFICENQAGIPLLMTDIPHPLTAKSGIMLE